MRWGNRGLILIFLGALILATVLQGIGTRFAVRIVRGSLDLADSLKFLAIVALYGLFLAGLSFLLRRGLPAGGRAAGLIGAKRREMDLMTSLEDRFPEASWSDRILVILLIVAVGAFALMLVWLIGR